MGAGADDIGFLAAIRTGSATGEADDVIGIIGASVINGAAINARRAGAALSVSMRMDILGSTDGEDVFCSAGRADAGNPRTGIAGGKDDDHFLVARGWES